MGPLFLDRLSRTALGWAFAVATVGALAGCSLLISTSDLTGGTGGGGDLGGCEGGACTPTGTRDAAGTTLADSGGTILTCGDADVTSDENDCGQCGHVCSGPTPRCLTSTCVAGCPGGIVYVAPTGADSNDGCTKTTPLATITRALAVVSSQNAAGEEIHVCKGTFTEDDMVVDYPVSLRGGYDCATWARTASFGYPQFDGINATVLATTAANPSGNTLAIAGNTIGAAVVIDGLTVEGPGTGGFTKLGAIIVSGNATPTLSNDDIEGATTSSVATVGLRLSIEGAPTVLMNRIGGGGGATGSFGVDVGQSSALYLHDNVISGGTSPTFSWGVIASTDVPLAGQPEYVLHNTINGGTGTTVIGLDLTDLSISVVGNVITGGAASCAGGDCASTGVRLDVDESVPFVVTVAQNRITSGTVAVPMGGTPSMIGLLAHGLARLDVQDNAIQAGSQGNTEGTGLALQSVTAANVQGNTVYGYGAALTLDTVADVDIDGNLFLTDTSGTAVTACTGTSKVDSLLGNAFVNTPNLVSASCSAGALTTVTSVESLYGASAIRGASGNRRVSSACGAVDSATQCITEAACVPGATDQKVCITHVLATWDDPSQGAADLLDLSRGWKLATPAPCGLAQAFATPLTDALAVDGGSALGGADDDLVDILGTTRSIPVSIGAYEDDGPCMP
jgi:hypothetical protein